MHIGRSGAALIAWTSAGGHAAHPDDSAAIAVSRHPEALIAGRMLARTLLAELTGLHADTVRLESDCPDCGLPHGKPRGVGAAARAHVSISHAGGHTFAVAALDHAVGIDAEPADASADRLAAIDAVAGASTDPLRHWTRVEAVLKADGRGLRVDPRSVEVDGDTATLEGRQFDLTAVEVDGFVVSVARACEAALVPGARTATL